MPRGSFVKRTDAGGVDFVSPFPSPFDYGALPDTRGPDGDRLDAVLLGGPRRRGELVTTVVRARLDFVDAGADDPKLVCSDAPLTEEERRQVLRFFTVYAWLKAPLNRLRGRPGPTRVSGFFQP